MVTALYRHEEVQRSLSAARDTPRLQARAVREQVPWRDHHAHSILGKVRDWHPTLQRGCWQLAGQSQGP